ncbi:MAG: AraC family transcriptional regulator ligand-binding domain-containing protein, partial [Solimonas sp.]
MVVDYACSRGVPLERLLEGTGLEAAVLQHPESRIALPPYARLVANAAALMQEPALGLLVGQQANLGAHGYVGYASMSSLTVGEAIRVGVKYSKIRSGPAMVHYRVDGDAARLTVDLNLPQDAFYRYVMEFTASTVLNSLRFYFGPRLPPVTIGLQYPPPDYAARYAELLAVPVRFAQAQNYVQLPASVLAQSLASANPALGKIAEQQCEALMATFRRHGRDDLPAQIQRILIRQAGHFPTQDELAKQLRMSPRTLRLHLLRHLTSYQKILGETRRDLSLHYLKNTALTVEDIGSLLDYRDAPSFA